MFLAKLVDAIDYFDADDCSLPIFQVEEMKLILNMIRPYLKRYKKYYPLLAELQIFSEYVFCTPEAHVSIRM